MMPEEISRACEQRAGRDMLLAHVDQYSCTTTHNNKIAFSRELEGTYCSGDYPPLVLLLDGEGTYAKLSARRRMVIGIHHSGGV